MAEFIDDGLLKDFFDEAYTQVEIIEENLLKLEKEIDNKDAINELFRATHTLKGGSATVQMNEITDFTHLLEDVLDEIREDKIKINTNIIDILLNALDIIKNMINIRNKGKVYKKDYSSIINSLKKIKDKKTKVEKTPKKGEKKDKKKDKEEYTDKSDIFKKNKFKLSEYDLLEIMDANIDNLPIYKIIVIIDETNPMRTVSGIQIFTSLRDIGIVLKTIPDFDEIYSDNFYKEIMYIVATSLSINKIREYLIMPDTTENVFIEKLNTESISKSNISEIKKLKKEKINIGEIEIESEENAEELSEEEKKYKEELIEKLFSDKEKVEVDHKNVSSSIIRVDSIRIDNLLNLVSEIVINKASYNQVGNELIDFFETYSLKLNEYKDTIKQFFESNVQLLDNVEKKDILIQMNNDFQNLYKIFDPILVKLKSTLNRFKSTYQALDRISNLLQEGVMKVRMIPLKHILNRFPRLVRDLSRRLDKKIELVIKGEETEVDKAMIDYLSDPLIHIIRNSIDHGFESESERKISGKNPVGKLELSANSEGNVINIHISDDGRGINLEKIRKKAIELKLINQEDIIKEHDLLNRIFEPGFTTVEEVTSVSGRGVGLDVVKKNIEKLNGSIRVDSIKGKGTNFNIKIPLTLAIIQGLMIEVSNEIYVIPISSVLESIKIKSEEIKSVDNYEVLNLRNEVISLLRLNKLFKLEEKKDSDFYFVVIVGSEIKKIGLLVDNVIGEEDIVIKPLKDKYTNTPGIGGATILGDGRVSLILNVSQLIDLGLKMQDALHYI